MKSNQSKYKENRVATYRCSVLLRCERPTGRASRPWPCFASRGWRASAARSDAASSVCSTSTGAGWPAEEDGTLTSSMAQRTLASFSRAISCSHGLGVSAVCGSSAARLALLFAAKASLAAPVLFFDFFGILREILLLSCAHSDEERHARVSGAMRSRAWEEMCLAAGAVRGGGARVLCTGRRARRRAHRVERWQITCKLASERRSTVSGPAEVPRAVVASASRNPSGLHITLTAGGSVPTAHALCILEVLSHSMTAKAPRATSP